MSDEPRYPIDAHLEERSRLDNESIRENYAGMYPRFDLHKAQELAVRAWECRVKRCADHISAGWDLAACTTFVYAKDEWREAFRRSRRPDDIIF